MGKDRPSPSLSQSIIIKTALVAILLELSQGQCQTGFNCVACPQGCDQCTTSSTSCDVCSKGYYISSTTCIACPQNCLECDSPSYCINCIPGYDSVTNAAGQEECEFKWWKWFLIIFGILLFIFLVGVLIYWIRLKWNQEENQEKEVQYQMKVENTENDVHP